MDFFESVVRFCIEGVLLGVVFLIGIYIATHADILSEHGFEVMLHFKEILHNAIWILLLILGVSILVLGKIEACIDGSSEGRD